MLGCSTAWMLNCLQAQSQLCTVVYNKPCCQRSLLAPRRAQQAARRVLAPPGSLNLLKRGMSMICSMVHGSNHSSSSSNNQSGSEPASNTSPQPEAPAVQPTPVVPHALESFVPAAATAAQMAAAASAELDDPIARQQAYNDFGQAYIKVIGCGGGGGNAIARMITAGLQVRMGVLGCAGAAGQVQGGGRSPSKGRCWRQKGLSAPELLRDR